MARYLKHKSRDVIVNSIPVAIIVLDYSSVAKLLAQLRKQTVTNVRKYLNEHIYMVKRSIDQVGVIECNKAALSLFGVTSHQKMIGSLRRTFVGSGRDVLIEQFVSLMEGKAIFEGEFKYRSPGRFKQDVFLSVTVPPGQRARLKRVIITMQDITAWKKIERTLRKKAQIDSLTKLLNQHAVIDRLEQEITRAKRYGLSLACMMIDLDFFKVINDKFGHQRGDSILKRVAKMIKNCFRKVDIVGRYGGDEFLVIMPETTTQNAKYAALRLQRIFASTYFKYKKVISFHITLSIGISGYPTKNLKDAKDLISIADKAMYSCKMAGRNRIEIAQ